MKLKDRIAKTFTWLLFKAWKVDIQKQSCKCCGKPSAFNFNVNNKDWLKISGKYKNSVLCLYCFDQLAKEKGFEYKLTRINCVTEMASSHEFNI